MPAPELYRSLEDRVSTVRTALGKARSFEAAMVVLSMADTETLRLIESDFFVHPGDPSTIRTRITKVHLRALNAPVNLTTERVSEDLVRHWARCTLEEYLSGHTDFFADTGGQYRLTLLGHEYDLDGQSSGDVFEVTTVTGYDPKRFRVTVMVKEMHDAG